MTHIFRELTPGIVQSVDSCLLQSPPKILSFGSNSRMHMIKHSKTPFVQSHMKSYKWVESQCKQEKTVIIGHV